MEFISSWAQGIIIAVTISTIIEMILPDSNIKKYVRTVIGAYIVFVIVSPIIVKITGKEIDLSTYKLPEKEIHQTVSIDTNLHIEDIYINKIKLDITKNILLKGYKVEKLQIEIEKKEENYGNINKINMKISKEENKASNIEPIEININNKPKQEEQITKEEIQELKEFLKENYGTLIENITIM